MMVPEYCGITRKTNAADAFQDESRKHHGLIRKDHDMSFLLIMFHEPSTSPIRRQSDAVPL